MADDTSPDGATGRDPLDAFGQFLRSQRQLANLSLRQLSELTDISNPYLSQIERGVHKPSVTVITSIAKALNLSAEALLAQAAGIDPDIDAGPSETDAAIRRDPRLSDSQKQALLAVYQSYVRENT